MGNLPSQNEDGIGFAFSNKDERASGRRSSLTREQIADIIHFLDAVQDIVDRLRSEGYLIRDGRIFPPNAGDAEPPG
ncbi:MAG: hypothetical protein WC931_02170 [Bacilli bacterium]|jgi:hypothetical protein